MQLVPSIFREHIRFTAKFEYTAAILLLMTGGAQIKPSA